MRKVMTVIFMDENMVLKAPENENQAHDRDTWCPGARVGEVIETPLNPDSFGDVLTRLAKSVVVPGANRDIVDYSRIQVDRTRELEVWAKVLPELAKKARTVYGYVNNHFAGHSPASVRMLQEMLGLPVMDPAKLGDQLTLF